MINYIAIDPSLISTGMVISSGDTFKIFNYCKKKNISTKTGTKKWFSMSEEHVVFRFIEYREFENYSEGELTKLKDYDAISDMILDDIELNIDRKYPTKIGIEGFNFGSSVGDLVDLVTFSTLLRKKLYDIISEDILVISPASLKLESCKLTYPPIDVGKRKPKLVYKNNIGIPGGSFTKREMFLAIIENDNLVDYWSEHCRSISGDILLLSSIPKPYDDVNDAFLIYNILKKDYI